MENKEAVETAALEWVAWFNDHRLLQTIGCIPPAEAEAWGRTVYSFASGQAACAGSSNPVFFDYP